MQLRRHAEDNGVRATTTATECPVQVRVVLRRGYQVLAGHRDDLPLEHVVGGHAVLAVEQRVPAALRIATAKGNAGTRAAHQSVSVFVGGLVCLAADDARADLTAGPE